MARGRKRVVLVAAVASGLLFLLCASVLGVSRPLAGAVPPQRPAGPRLAERSTEPPCAPRLDPETYAEVKGGGAAAAGAPSFHGYTALPADCGGQVYWADARRVPAAVPEGRKRELALYDERVVRDAGGKTGAFDSAAQVAFASRDVDVGVMAFPMEGDCKAGTRPADVSGLDRKLVLSTLLPAHGFQANYVREYVRHYAAHGVRPEDMLVTVHIKPSEPGVAGALRRTLSELASLGVYYDAYVGDWSSEALAWNQAHKLDACSRTDDWIIIADSDEFHEYPKAAAAFLRDAERLGVNFVRGRFADRVTEDGALSPYVPGTPITAQFPLQCELAGLFSLGNPRKVVAFRGSLRINRGHHRLALCSFWERRGYMHVTPWKELGCPPRREPHGPPKAHSATVPVHHFKWMAGQYEAAAYKARQYAHEPKIGGVYRVLLKHLDEHDQKLCTRCPQSRCTKAPKLSLRQPLFTVPTKIPLGLP